MRQVIQTQSPLCYAHDINMEKVGMIPLIATINDIDLVRIRDRVLTAKVFAAIPNDYPWDRFEQVALAVGVPRELASLGRSVFREAFQHDWTDALKVECGWLDGGQTMIYQMLGLPEQCKNRWTALLEMDGEEYQFGSVTNDIDDLADALEEKGYKLNYFR